MSDDLIEELRDWRHFGAEHVATKTNHCDLCAERMPCEWSLALTDIAAAADRIDELEAVLADLVEWLDRTDRKECAHTEHVRQVLGNQAKERQDQ